jgi:ankyrin repeat protein
MKLLLAHGADPKIPTTNGDTALMVAAGVGWVEG